MGFPEQLKKARLAIGYTQQEVADMMGITNSTYSGYETGKRQPDVEKIKQLAGILHTSGDILLETGYEDQDEKVFPVNPRSDQVMALFEKLRPEYQNFVLDQLRHLVELQDINTR